MVLMRKYCLPLTLGCIFSLCANPEAPVVIAGNAKFHHDGALMQIQCSDRTIIDWKSFSISPQEIAEFIQTNANSAVLNRVKGFDPSEILGSLQSNGILYLINPNGVLVGDGAIINTASFISSTLDVSNDQFLAGNELLFEGDSKASIRNLGTIQAFDGDVALIACRIENPGKIEALNGTASMAYGQSIFLKLKSEPLLTISTGIDGDGIDHSGVIQALRTEIQMSGPYALAVNVSGTIEATSLVKEQGKIFLRSDGGKIELTKSALLEARQGKIEISSNGLTIDGKIISESGKIQIQNQGMPLIHSGVLDVSGNGDAGEISIATSKLLNGGKVLADSDQGCGGTISIQTDGPFIETNSALLSAKSVHQNGGCIEVCTPGSSLYTSGTYVTESIHGQGGEIHLSGTDIFVMAADLNASGSLKGGNILIGGDLQGLNPEVLNASNTFINHAAKITAEGSMGDGGKIVIWSEKKTECYGTLSAGSLTRGDGGLIEISSHGELSCGGEAHANAAFGRPGTVILDPQYIVIDAATGVYPQYQLFDPNPAATSFGTVVKALTNGTIAVTKPNDNFSAVDSGAAYLFNGLTAALISTLVGTTAADLVSSGGVTVLTNGNCVISSPDWNSGMAAGGAATFMSGSTGVSTSVSTGNSLYGTTLNDQIGRNALGETGVIALPINGNYIVLSPLWNLGATLRVGAATAVSGTTGIPLQGVSAGEAVSSTNSMRGSTLNDQIGFTNVAGIPGGTALANGNYVVISSLWNHDAIVDAGGVTFGTGTTGLPVGAITVANTLHSFQADRIGNGGVYALNRADGNFAICSPDYDLSFGIVNAGAVTVCSGTTGNPLIVTAAPLTRIRDNNSIQGSNASATNNTFVGSGGVVALPNGNGVVVSPRYRTNMVNLNVGAVTCFNGATGRPIVGASLSVISTNSILGTTTQMAVGGGGVFVLSNGNYVISSPDSDVGGGANSGAVTVVNGTTAIPVGGGAVGNNVTAVNSFHGTLAGERVSSGGILALSNGNFVVGSPTSGNGRATLINGTTGVPIAGGTIAATATDANSLHGSTAGDGVGQELVAFPGGNYAVISPAWDNGATTDVGAITVVNGATGIPVIGGATVGDAVSPANSLIGSTMNDQLGSQGAITTTGDFIVVNSPLWDGIGVDSGAVTAIKGSRGLVGPITAVNSILGPTASSGLTASTYDTTNNSFAFGYSGSGSGIVNAGIFLPSQMTYARAQSQTMTIHPSFITTTLGEGTAVEIQSNSDTTINPLSPLIVAGSSAPFTIRAGRSIIINSNVTTNNGSLNLFANEPLATGVVDAFRDAGAAVLSVANGVTINVGTGSLTAQLLDGAGLTNNTSANVSLGIGTSFLASGGGAISVLAQINNIAMDATSLIQSANGNIALQAGQSISIGTAAMPASIQATGSGSISILAQTQNISMGNTSLVQGAGGNIGMQAGSSVFIGVAAGGGSVTTTGAGTISIIAQALDITSGSGALIQTVNGSNSLQAGRSIAIGTAAAPASVSATGSGPISILAQSQDISLGNTSLVQAASNNILMQAGNSIFIGTAAAPASVISAGSGTVTVYAVGNNIAMGLNSLVQSFDGDILMQAGHSLVESSPFIIRNLGSGGITIVVDDLFPLPPDIGPGIVNIANGTIISGNFVNLYLVTPYVNFFPLLINGSNYTIGDASAETYGTYYPVTFASGFPFHIYYKVGFAPPPPPIVPPASAAVVIAQFVETIMEPPFWWRHPIYGGYLDYDPYAPYLTYKGLNLIIPALVEKPKQEEK